MSSTAEEIALHDRLIREVFIEPIRTVIVVDDEYPTLDSFISKEGGRSTNWNQKKQENVPRVRDLLKFARGKDRPWLIDVYDAPGSEKGVARHLHHSDLLVLDYHLQGDSGDGDAAIAILRELAAGDHFNLVIVHTKGDDWGNLDGIIRKIALSLSYPDPGLSFQKEEDESIKTSLEQWEDLENGIISKLQGEIITEDTYLKARSSLTGKYERILGWPEGERILDFYKAKPKQISLDTKMLAKWLLFKKQEQLTKQFSSAALGSVHVGRSGDINWIRSDKLFVTVLSKECSPEQFDGKLLGAIKASYPSPHRLLLAKMRAVLDERGLSAEAAILGNQFIQVEWLNEFLNPEPIDTKSVIYNSVSRHWEALGDQLRASIDNFAQQLHDYFSTIGMDAVMAECGLNKADVGSTEALKRFNCFSSTKPFDRSHLTTGHVFRRANARAEEGEGYWICLSPACDMVPRQENLLGSSDSIPFIAVRLHAMDDNRALKDAAKNIFLFLDIDGQIKAFSIHKDGIAQNPEWGQMFALNKGKFQNINQLKIGSINGTDGNVSLTWADVTIVAQLRSEYALNLLQRIGIMLSRPGLGMNFKSRSQN